MTQSSPVTEYDLVRFVQPGIPLGASPDTLAHSKDYRITLTEDGERVQLVHRRSGRITEVFRDRVQVLERDPVPVKKAANG